MTNGSNVSADFISHVAEFLVILSNESVHSKQVVKIEDMIKHCDLLLASGHEPEVYGEISMMMMQRIEFISFRFV